jgi:nicotinamidase-related amidase
MAVIDRHRASVLFIDMQERLVPEVELGNLVALMCERLMAWLSDQQAAVVVTEHCAAKLGNTVFEVPKTATRVDKTAFSAIKEHSVQVIAPQQQVIVCGMESHVCVFQTVMDLLEAQKQVFVVTDLVASRDPIDKMAALARMQAAGAMIVTIEMVLFEWVRNTSDESFGSMLQLVKRLRQIKVTNS